MKYLLPQLAIIHLLVGAALAQDPVRVAPDAYKLEFENEYVKAQRVHYAPRVKIPEHDHTAFGAAYVYLNDAGPVIFKHVGLSYGAVIRPAVKAGSFRLYKAVKETHEVENISDTPSDFLRVEFKTEPARDPNTLRGKFFREDVPVGENFQKSQFENEQIRITRLICAAGKKLEYVANESEPVLFVALTAAHFKPAKDEPIRLAPGQTRWVEAGKKEQWENLGKEDAELLRFDFKTAPLKNPGIEKPPEHPHSSPSTPGAVGSAEMNARASEHLKRGASLETAGKIEESIVAHEQALEINPGLVQAHINLISLYGRTKRFDKAEKAYRNALAINPELPDIHYNFGVLMAGQERFQEAAQAFQSCLRFNPYYAEAHHNYAVLIEREGKLDEAAAHYRKAIENKSGHRSAHFHLGRILVNQNRLSEAIEHFLQTLAPEDEDTPRFTYALGATYIRAGDRQKGVHYLREALTRASALNQTRLASSIERDLKTLERDN
ncbi:MAG TPA: tetratricopeptide repeat protein [Blastocatellia bacterium]|nr:tetratricopeptide repeat protein [Blastocatellia bacterium]